MITENRFHIFVDIEELTHKTGNFKQFDVFLSMLESALDKVSLDLILNILLKFSIFCYFYLFAEKNQYKRELFHD